MTPKFKKRIMLVDDSTMVRVVLRNKLRQDPRLSVVASSRDGHDALSVLSEAQPDLIVLDLEMPEVDGLTFISRSRGKTHAPILVLTVAEDKIAQARSLGAASAILKPRGSIHELGEANNNASDEFMREVYRLLGLSPL